MRKFDLTFGSDPEVFLVDSQGNPVSAIGLIGGSKEAPRPVPLGAVQEDNVLAEFNIIPTTELDEFKKNIHGVMGHLGEILPQFRLMAIPSMRFDMEYLKSCGPKAMEFGCDPDYNIWNLRPNPKPDSRTNLRTAGGHIHVGHQLLTEFDIKEKFIKMMDIYLGIPSVLMDRDMERRSLYGKAGAYRDKPYGVEYRTLSNFWISDDGYMDWVYESTHEAFNDVLKCDDLVEDIGGGDYIQSIINESRVDEARRVVERLSIRVA